MKKSEYKVNLIIRTRVVWHYLTTMLQNSNSNRGKRDKNRGNLEGREENRRDREKSEGLETGYATLLFTQSELQVGI